MEEILATISEEITELETQLTKVRNDINKIQIVKESEEGSSQSRFMQKYTNIEVLYERERVLNTRLKTLKASQ